MYTLGSDAEVFLRDATGKYIASCGKFGGTKARPKQMFYKNYWDDRELFGYAVQEDNVALEFNIPAAKNREGFKANLDRALKECARLAAEQGLVLAIDPAVSFPQDQLESKEAKVFGCDPDFNVWTLQNNPRPQARDPNLRTASAHIHVGIDRMDKIGFGRAMDLFLGCPSVVLDPDRMRRELYGKAGCVRLKPYGIEYRTLSNFWLKNHIDWVYDAVGQVERFVNEKRVIEEATAKKIIKCVNNFDQALLKELTAEFKLQY